jgi:hypothetical protein
MTDKVQPYQGVKGGDDNTQNADLKDVSFSKKGEFK